MALPQGIDFRSTAGYVTDPANCDYEISPGGGNYPRTTAQGNTVGWEASNGGNIRDRNTGVDPRLAGTCWSSPSTTAYRIDLPASGSYNVRLAAGDYGSYGVACAWDLYDTTTLQANLTTGSTSAAKRWKDAQNVEYTDATWPGSNSVRNFTFSTTILRLKAPTSGNISHFYVESAGGGGPTFIAARPMVLSQAIGGMY